MTNPEHEPTTPNDLLPIVSRDVLAAVSAEFMQNESREAETLILMSDENPDLARGINIAILHLGRGDTQHTKDLITATTMLYQCLRSQAEATAIAFIYTP